MQKWEYLYLEGYLLSATKPRAMKVNNEPLSERPNLWEYINQLGAEGWELVNAYNLSKPDVHKDFFVFKRPVE